MHVPRRGLEVVDDLEDDQLEHCAAECEVDAEDKLSMIKKMLSFLNSYSRESISGIEEF